MRNKKKPNTDSVIPAGWLGTHLGDVVKPSKEKIEPSSCKRTLYLSLEHIEANTNKIVGHGLSEDVKSTKSVFYAGDVLYGKLRPYLNKVCIPLFDGICSTDIIVFPKSDFLNNNFLLYYLTQNIVVSFANHHMSGVQLPRISFDKLSELKFFLPPFNEQKRIVNKLEKLLSRVNQARDRLAKVPEIIKRFRQSVLSAACSGKLTEDWREKNTGEETGEDLYRKIKEKIDESRCKRNNFHEGLDLTLYDIPESWFWTDLESICKSINDGDHQAPPKSNRGVPFIVISNISDGLLDLSNTKYVPKKYFDSIHENRIPKHGDILYSVTGSFGISILVDTDESFCFQRHIALIKSRDEISNLYLLRTLQSSFLYKQASKIATGIAQLTVPLRGLRSFKIPLPPYKEQKEIVRRVESLLKLADTVEARVSKARAQVEKLTQSILSKAFQGELVPTEAELATAEGRTYETAEQLLERIKEEREKEPKGKTKARVKPRQK